jgi:hypothetical protein
LAETCVDTSSDGPSDVLNGSDDDDDNFDSESYSYYEPETARKIKKTVVPFI